MPYIQPGAVYAVEAEEAPWAGTWGMCKVLAVDDGVLVVRGTTARFNTRPENIDIPDDVIDTSREDRPLWPEQVLAKEFAAQWSHFVGVVAVTDAEATDALRVLSYVNASVADQLDGGEGALGELLAAPLSEVRATAREIRTRRDAGQVWIEFGSTLELCPGVADPRRVADALVQRLELRPIGDQWMGVSREQALALVEAVLWKDLAYGAENMSRDNAQRLAVNALGWFPKNATFLTNGMVPNRSCGHSALTDSVIDTGIVAVAQPVVGMLWVEDVD